MHSSSWRKDVREDVHIPDTDGVTLWYLMCRVGG